MAYTLFNSVFAHSMEWHEDEKMFQLKMDGFDDFFLFRVNNLSLNLRVLDIQSFLFRDGIVLGFLLGGS